MSLEGQHIGRYHLVELLGSGGMGEVYLATDVPVNRQVAIKVIRSEASPYPDSQATQEAARLFQREVKAIAGLDHPNILPLFDYGEETVRGMQIIYMVMPLRQEGTIATWLRQRGSAGLLSPTDIANIITQTASALQYAHDRQVIHQDVKPSNFLIRYNEANPNQPYVQLSDFGVAKITTATSSASQSVRGTPAYMAPEQWEGNPVPATDQYALAVMAYELLTGRPPFQGGLGQMMYQHMNVQPQPPSTYNSYIPEAVDQVLLIALQKKPKDRFHSISAFARAFQQAVQQIDAPTMLKIQNSMQVPAAFASSQNKSPGQDIHATLAISLEESFRGTTRTLTLSDGRRIFVSVPAGMRDGDVLRLDSQGNIVTDTSATEAIVLTIAVQPSTRPAGMVQPHEYAYTAAASNPTPPLTVRSGKADHHDSQALTLKSDGAIHRQAQPGTNVDKTLASRFSMTNLLLLTLVILLLVGGGIYFARAGFGNSSGNNPVNTTPITIASHGQTAATTPPPASTAVPTSVPTSSPASTNPYTQSGTLVLNDPLTSNNLGYVWTEGTNNNGATCQFTSSGYDITQPKSGLFHACNAQSTNYSNFVFEVQMNMISGDYAGLVFRNNPSNSSYYLFFVKPVGQYNLKLYDSGDPNGQILSQGNIGPIQYNQTYYLAVVADYANIDLYVNRQQVASISDPTLTQGEIGLLVGNVSNSAEALFYNAKVWTL